MKPNNSLNGPAWTLTRKKAEISAQAVLDEAVNDPLAAVKLVVTTVRQACERIAPLQKQQAFEEYFFRGCRNRTESVQDYISRRET
eukprot:9401038-Pyramimonas_sp.AAC.1